MNFQLESKSVKRGNSSDTTEEKKKAAVRSKLIRKTMKKKRLCMSAMFQGGGGLMCWKEGPKGRISFLIQPGTLGHNRVIPGICIAKLRYNPQLILTKTDPTEALIIHKPETMRILLLIVETEMLSSR